MKALMKARFLTCLLAGLFIAAPAFAQVPTEEPPEAVPTAEVDEQELNAVAQAYVEVQSTHEAYQARLTETQDPQQATEMQQELATEVNGIITDEGLTVERYDEVIQAANADEDLRNRLLTKINEIVQDEQ